jgi:hypothetical protein
MLTDHVEFLQSDPHGTTVRAEKILRHAGSRSPAGASKALVE